MIDAIHSGRNGATGFQAEGAVLETLGLFDGTADAALDAVVRIVRRVLSVPVAVASIIDEDGDRQVFKSQSGLPEPWATLGQTRLSHSFCAIVRRENRPLIVENAPQDARVCDNGAIGDLGVRAYLGVPLHGPNDAPIGALAAINTSPRLWRATDLELLTDLAICCDERLRLIHALMEMEAKPRR